MKPYAVMLTLAVGLALCGQALSQKKEEVKEKGKDRAAYPCKIINRVGTAVRVKLVGYGPSALYTANIKKDGEEITPQGSYIEEGERIVGAWDVPTGKLYVATTVTISEPTIITIEADGPGKYKVTSKPYKP